MPRFLLPLLLTLLLFATLALGLRHDPTELPSPLVGRPAPAFALARLDPPGSTFSPAALRGQVWLLNVWASWCAACREEHPQLQQLARQGLLPLVGLTYKDAPEPALAWLARQGDPYTLSVQDPQGQTGIDYGVYGVPETFLIDHLGIVRYRHAGPLTPALLADTVLPLVQRLQQAAAAPG